MGRSAEELLDELYAEEEAREDSLPGDLAALSDVVGRLTETLETVKSRSTADRVESIVAKRHDLALDRLGEQMGVFLSEQADLMGGLMAATSSALSSVQSASAATIQSALDAHAKQMGELLKAAQERHDASMAKMAELVAAVTAPRKRTPVRDPSGEILHVRDEPWA